MKGGGVQLTMPQPSGHSPGFAAGEGIVWNTRFDLVFMKTGVKPCLLFKEEWQ